MTSGVQGSGAADAYGNVNYRSWSGPNGRTNENSYSGKRIQSSRGSGNLVVRNTVSGAIISTTPHYGYDYIDPTVFTWAGVPGAELKLLGRLVDKVKGHDFYGSTALAEIDKSIEGVVRTARSVIYAARAVSRGDVGSAIRLLAKASQGSIKPTGKNMWVEQLKGRDVASTWLALQYGWKPLLSDVYAFMKYLEAKAGPPRTANFRVSLKIQEIKDMRQSNGYPPFLCTLDWRKELRVKAVEQLSTVRSLGLADPASILWERLPFSFVLDWFIPVGQYLQTLSDIQGMVYGNVYYTTFYELKGSCSVDTSCGSSNYQPHDAYCRPGSDHTHKHECANVTRLHATRLLRGQQFLSVPKPSWKALDKAFSLGHLENAAALIAVLSGPKSQARAEIKAGYLF